MLSPAEQKEELMKSETKRWKQFIQSKLNEKNLEYLIIFTDEEKEVLKELQFKKIVDVFETSYVLDIEYLGVGIPILGYRTRVKILASRDIKNVNFLVPRKEQLIAEFLNEFDLKKLKTCY